MRRFTPLALVLAIGLAVPIPAAASDHYGAQITRKFFRGVWNIALSPAELWIQGNKEGIAASKRGVNPNERLAAVSSGVVLGVGYMFGRIGTGMFDVVTFPWPTHPLMTPAVVYLDEDSYFGRP